MKRFILALVCLCATLAFSGCTLVMPDGCYAKEGAFSMQLQTGSTVQSRSTGAQSMAAQTFDGTPSEEMHSTATGDNAKADISAQAEQPKTTGVTPQFGIGQAANVPGTTGPESPVSTQGDQTPSLDLRIPLEGNFQPNEDE
jgi:hypothetical protein